MMDARYLVRDYSELLSPSLLIYPELVRQNLETMIAMGATNLPERAMRQQISSAIQLVVQQTRMSDGSRKVTSVSEITGMTGDVVAMQDIFVFEKLGIDVSGRVLGRFKATGVSPKFAERLKAVGFELPLNMFDQSGGQWK